MHLTRSRNCSDKRRFDTTANSLHFAKGAFKRQSHLLAGQITRCEDKFAHGMLFKSTPLQEAIADSLVGGEQDPTFLANERQPGFVRGSTGKMV